MRYEPWLPHHPHDLQHAWHEEQAPPAESEERCWASPGFEDKSIGVTT